MTFEELQTAIHALRQMGYRHFFHMRAEHPLRWHLRARKMPPHYMDRDLVVIGTLADLEPLVHGEDIPVGNT